MSPVGATIWVDDSGMAQLVDLIWTWAPHQESTGAQVIITEAKEEWFGDWKDAKQGRRGKDYEQMKQRFQANLLRKRMNSTYSISLRWI